MPQKESGWETIRLRPNGQSLKHGKFEHFQNDIQDTLKTKGKISRTLETRRHKTSYVNVCNCSSIVWAQVKIVYIFCWKQQQAKSTEGLYETEGEAM